MSGIALSVVLLAILALAVLAFASRGSRAFLEEKRKRRRAHKAVRMPDPAPHGRRAHKKER